MKNKEKYVRSHFIPGVFIQNRQKTRLCSVYKNISAYPVEVLISYRQWRRSSTWITA